MRVTIHTHTRTSWQDRAVCCAQLSRQFGGHINVDQARDSIAPKQAAPPLCSPDDTGIDHSPVFYFFIRRDLVVWLDDRALLDDRVIADHRACKHDSFALD